MHRLLVESGALHEAHPSLSKDALNHLKVLRPKDGEEVELFDGAGRTRVYRYAAEARALVEPLPAVVHPRPAVALTLFACVTKGSRWDWTIEKATELGVTRIVPVISERTIVRIDAAEREAKRERWMRIAADAARQSDAVWLPEVLAPVAFADSLALVAETTCFVGALTTPPSLPLAEAVLASRGGFAAGRGFGVYVGPEGDFTPEELAALLKVARPTSFGPTVLRAETAAVYALAVVSSLIDRSRGDCPSG